MDDAERWLDAISIVPETLLRRARSSCGAERAHYARLGLDLEPLDPEIELHLLRQLYRGQLEESDLEGALQTAKRMTNFDTMRDVAYHDVSRVLSAFGDFEGAVWQQRAAARYAGPDRRSFHLWSLATVEHFAGRNESALQTLDRAVRWATHDRSLIDAHRAYIQVSSGDAPEGLDDTLERLSRDGLRGYRLYLRGMIAYHQGSSAVAQLFLERWIRSHANSDSAQKITLHEELRRSQAALSALSAHPD